MTKNSLNSKIIIAFTFLIALSSCSNKFSLQKRKYRKGFYFASSTQQNKQSISQINKNQSTNKTENELFQLEKVKSKPVNKPDFTGDARSANTDFIREKKSNNQNFHNKQFSNKTKVDSVYKIQVNSVANQTKHTRLKANDNWYNDPGSFWGSLLLILILVGVYLIVDSGLSVSFAILSYILGGILLVLFIIALIFILSQYNQND